MMEIKREYLRLMAEDTRKLVSPAVEHLQSLGYVATLGEGIPTVFVALPKSVILEIEPEPWVGGIYLADQIVEKEMDTAGSSDRAPAVWGNGFDGSGVDIAILEPGKIDFTDSIDGYNYLHQGLVRECSLGSDEHKTAVASIVGSYHPIYTGIAKGALMHDACTNGTLGDTINALSWATNNASIINFSAAINLQDGLEYSDKAFDHYARHNIAFITKSAGNNGGYITSPGYGWNVMTVGATDYQNTSDWSDDEMRSSSSWQNHSSSNVEKPEVVAPGQTIKTIGLDGSFYEDSGTSYVAPQVAGLAALMVDRNADLAAWPTAIKAIIMASAVNNIEGPRLIQSGQDLKDGAGAIDAALADQIARTHWASTTSPCLVSCWWGIDFSNNSLPIGSSLDRYFNASKGERVRVAIAWWSKVECPSESNCNDELGSDLDLRIYNPSGSLAVSSLSLYNNYEIVEFTASETGKYNLRVKKYSSTESQSSVNNLGIAVSRNATYLPDIRNSGSWVSEISIVNSGAEPQDVSVTFSNGTQTIWWSLPPHRQWKFPVSQNVPAGFAGSAIVNASEGVSVIVETTKNSGQEQTNYSGILPVGGSGSGGWELTGPTLYAPVVKRNSYSRSSSIDVVNTGTSSTNVYVVYYDSAGGSRTEGPFTLNPNAKTTLTPGGTGSGGCNASGTICSAKIYSSGIPQPLAAVVREYNASGELVVTTHNAFSSGANTIYFPVVKYSSYSMSTGLRVQNVGNTSTNITVQFYDKFGNQVCSLVSSGVSPLAASTFNLSSTCPGTNFVGIAIATASQPLVGMANEVSVSGQNRKKAYSAFLGGSQAVYAPLIYGDQSSWTSGIAVQNIGGGTANVTLCYYDTSGVQHSCVSGQTIPYHGMAVFTPPTGLVGSAMITSDWPIAAIVNIVNKADSGDTQAIYNASNR